MFAHDHSLGNDCLSAETPHLAPCTRCITEPTPNTWLLIAPRRKAGCVSPCVCGVTAGVTSEPGV